MAISRTDLEVRRDVSDVLASDIRVDAQHLDVEVVDGIVYVRGAVPSLYEKRIATEITNRIKGVIDVVNELRVASPSPRHDHEIGTDLRAALRRDCWVDETRIEPTVQDGKVHLTGVVSSYAEKSYAETDAWSVPGVTDVANDLEIQSRESRSDEEIAEHIRADLGHNIRIDPAAVIVSVESGVVTLRGTVAAIEQKWLSDEIAWWTAGVRDVVNELRVADGDRTSVEGKTPS
jgi:osmotically-inducible protein OsmY